MNFSMAIKDLGHTNIHTYIHTHTYIYTYIRMCIYVQTYIHIHTYVHTHTHTHMHTYTYMYVYVYIQTYMHTYIHTYMYTYIHTYILVCSNVRNLPLCPWDSVFNIFVTGSVGSIRPAVNSRRWTVVGTGGSTGGTARSKERLKAVKIRN
jgi:hypothetical protein